MQTLLQNLRFAMRMLAKTPGMTFAILLTLSLGIGANSAIFSVTDALLLRPFPFRQPDQLVHIVTTGPNAGSEMNLTRYEMLRDHARSFQQIAVWAKDDLNLTGDGLPLQVPISRVSPNFFQVLGVQPALGRSFTVDEGQPQGKPVALLSDSLWRSRYHSDPAIVGKTIQLDSTACTVIGVLPHDLPLPFVGPADVWIPRYFEFSLMPAARLRQGVGYLQVLARLQNGVNLGAANSELAVLDQQYRAQNPSMPDAASGMGTAAEPLRDMVVGNLRTKVLVLMGAVGLVLLIACANVASLLLARGLARRREVAVRAALGASRASIIAQLLTESLALSLIAGALGIALGWAMLRALAVWGASELPQGLPLTINTTVVAFTAATAVCAGILFGLFPALQLARLNLNATLREEGRAASTGRGQSRLMNLLVVGQVTLSVLLLIAAGLLTRSFVRLLHADPGFQPDNVLTLNVSLSTQRYAKPEQQIAFFHDLLQRVGALPGVRSTAVSAALPLSYIRVSPVLPQGQPDVPLAQRPFVDIEAISPAWFDTLHAPMRMGRAFNDQDQPQSPPVVVVNESFARKYWPNLNPLTQHVVIGRRPVPALVVGVAADVKNRGLEQDPQPQLYLPFAQLPWGSMYLLVRSTVPPQTILPAIQAQVAALDPEQPVMHPQTVEDLMHQSRTQPRFLLMLLAAFATIAALLTVIGIYGVLSYAVAQRRHEFSIRMALGAERADILRLVVKHALLLTATGSVIGLGAAFFIAGLLRTMLYKTSLHDAAAFAGAPIVFVAVALLAAYLPAARATKANPVDALR